MQDGNFNFVVKGIQMVLQPMRLNEISVRIHGDRKDWTIKQ